MTLARIKKDIKELQRVGQDERNKYHRSNVFNHIEELEQLFKSKTFEDYVNHLRNGDKKAARYILNTVKPDKKKAFIGAGKAQLDYFDKLEA